ncbi:hypothetical protein VTN00DRAFT_3594 [Thermoascus crustaceus]|uniref:uncharacterized protein n=1 Tax=Thermoascus crustaceus TaxID=5088 RepID=UPI003743D0E6
MGPSLPSLFLLPQEQPRRVWLFGRPGEVRRAIEPTPEELSLIWFSQLDAIEGSLGAGGFASRSHWANSDMSTWLAAQLAERAISKQVKNGLFRWLVQGPNWAWGSWLTNPQKTSDRQQSNRI